MKEKESQGKLFLGAETDSQCCLETGVGVGRRGSDSVGGHPTTMEGGWGRGQGWDEPGTLRRQGGVKAGVCARRERDARSWGVNSIQLVPERGEKGRAVRGQNARIKQNHFLGYLLMYFSFHQLDF